MVELEVKLRGMTIVKVELSFWLLKRRLMGIAELGD
jgi:hypothetical protein